MADQILEAEGVLGEISVKELPMYFIALDTDLLSLELNDSYAKLYLVSRRVHAPPVSNH